MGDEKKTYLINIESNLNEYADEAAKAKKRVDELKAANDELKQSGKASTSELESSSAALRNAQKEYKQAQKLVELQTEANRSETGSRKQLEAQLKLEMAALGKLGKAHVIDAQGRRMLNPLYTEQRIKIAAVKQSIIDYDQALNDGRSNVGRYGASVKEAMAGIGNSFTEVTSAVGGTTGAIGDAVTSFLSAGGVIGVVTAAISLLAKAWKNTQENIELYLKSADKLKFGFAGFEKDAEKVRKDALNRAFGQINTGRASLTEANRIMDFSKSTPEQKEQAKLMAEQAKLMIEEGMNFRDQVFGIKDKITWTLEYNKLLQEEEQINDDKLAKEIEWEGLEANLIKQRAIVSSLEATEADKKAAAIEADKIANQLVLEKTEFIDRQIANVEAISEKTFTQEVVEGRLNELLKQKNTIQKEYQSDQIKINKLEKASVKDAEAAVAKAKAEAIAAMEKSKAENKRWLAAQEQIKKESAERKEKEKKDAIDLEAWEHERALLNQESLLSMRQSQHEWEFNLERKRLSLQEEEEVRSAKKTGADVNLIHAKYSAARKNIDEAEAAAKLQLYANFAGNLATIFGEHTAIGRAAAIAQTTIATYQSATEAYKSLVGVPVVGPVLAVAAAAAALKVGFDNVRKIASTKSGLPGDSGTGPTSISSAPAAQRIMATQVSSTVLTQPQLSQQQLNAIPQNGQLTVDQLVEAFKKLPPPVTTIEDINAKQKSTNKVMSRANI